MNIDISIDKVVYNDKAISFFTLAVLSKIRRDLKKARLLFQNVGILCW